MYGRDFPAFSYVNCILIGNIHSDSSFGLDLFSIRPDRDVKKARFRQALIRDRLRALQIGLVF